MMKTLTKIGIVLVVLAMVTSTSFANEYEGPSPGSWCDDVGNWSTGNIPECGDGETTKIRDSKKVIINCAVASCDKLEMRGSSKLTVGVPAVRTTFTVCKELDMSDDKSSDFTTLIVKNGDMLVKKQSKDLAEDGDILIEVWAGSSLKFDDGLYFGDSNDGTKSVYTLNLAGDFTNRGDRTEQRGGHLIVNLTGNGTFDISHKTARLSSDDDSMATINISGGKFITKKLELGQRDDGVKSPYTYSMEVNVSGGSWDGDHGDAVKDQDDGQILNINVTGGSVELKDLSINDDDSEINITMSGGTFDVSDDIEMNAGDIVITGGVFNVEDDFELGDDGVATMTVSGTADVWIDDLYMGNDSELTINGVRMDLDDLKEMKSGSEIDILAGGSLVIKNADDQAAWNAIAALINAGKIRTSSAGMVIVWDYGVSHDGKLTIRPVIPVDIDITPGGCPNPLRVNFIGGGVYPVAIVGGDFDVLEVDVSTITLAGVSPKRSSYDDVSTAGAGDCECGAQGPDGTLDLVLKFDRQALLEALDATYGDLTARPHRDILNLTLDADLYESLGAIPIQGLDCLVISNRGAIKPKK